MPDNLLFYGDNLPVLRDHFKDESVDLIYLDPPFKSGQDYNVLFKEQDGSQAAAQLQAFEDTWEWGPEAEATFHDTVLAGGRVSQVMQSFRSFLSTSTMMAYLAMMAPRLVELCRVLKPTGALYLHCDPTAGHYLKLLLDAVFGPQNFLNEISWKRTGAHGSAKRFGPVHDLILFYAKSDGYTWNQPYTDQEEYIKQRYTYADDAGKRFYPVTLHAAGLRNGSSGQPWRGIDIAAKGGHWKYTIDKLDALDAAGHIYWPAKGSMPRLKMYAENAKGAPVQDWWDDVPALNSQAAERLGYATQKPEALLERIICASSNEGDTVLDPFCGCGTAVVVAQRLNRRWLGIDITHLAITVMRNRLRDAFGDQIDKAYRVIGEPASLFDAIHLALQDRYQFQWWALSKVGACPTAPERKKGADKGIDGRLYFFDDAKEGNAKQVVFSVKSGNLKPDDVRALLGVVEREKVALGVLLTLEGPTKPMQTDATAAGFYVSPWGGAKCPRIQIITIEDLMAGQQVQLPPNRRAVAFRPGPKAKAAKPKQGKLFDQQSPPARPA